MDEFKIGDIVSLKDGLYSCNMVIDLIVNDRASCVWFNSNGDVSTFVFPVVCLIKQKETHDGRLTYRDIGDVQRQEVK